MPPAVADAGRLLALKRGHWGIENGLHHVNDVTFGEDRSLLHKAMGPTIVATLRGAARNLLRLDGCRRIASRVRAHAEHPDVALALVLAPIPARA